MSTSIEEIGLEPDLILAGTHVHEKFEPITLAVPVFDLPRFEPERGWLQAAAFAVAVILHAAALALCLGQEADQHGEDGSRLEAIAVSIVLAAPNTAGAAEARQSVPELEPPSKTSATATETLRKDNTEEPIEPKAEVPKPKERKPDTKKLAARAEAEPLPAASPPEPAPDPSPREQPIVEPPPPIERTPDRPPQPMTETPPPEPPVERKPVADPVAAPPPAAPPAPPPTPKSASTTIASAGVMRAYAKRVAIALARSKPKGMGRRGTVRLRFVVGRAGKAETVEIVQSSDQPRLDRLAVSTISRITFPAPPPNASTSQTTFVVPFEFR